MSKIGILTFHRAYNYGAVLQCYALKEVLKRMGHDVSVIDYRQPDIEKFYRFHSAFSLRKGGGNIFRYLASFFVAPFRDIRYFIRHRQLKKIFEDFQCKRFNLSDECNESIPTYFDRYVIGSDMLWAYDVTSDKYDPIYLGEFDHSKESKIIGYAISGTPDSFHRLGEERRFDFLDNFSSFSIREKSLGKIVSLYTNKDVTCCIDPTLLTTKDFWSDFMREKKVDRKYIVTYYLRVSGRRKKNIDDRIKNYAHNNGLEVINIDVCNSLKPYDVEDFVSIISGAQYVITDSFHGVVFSLIFERPLHAICLNDSHDARYVDILNKIGAGELIVDLSFIPHIPQVDFEEINLGLESFRLESLEFLKRSI